MIQSASASVAASPSESIPLVPEEPTSPSPTPSISFVDLTNSTIPVLESVIATDLNLTEPEELVQDEPPENNTRTYAQNLAVYAVPEVPDLGMAADVVDSSVPGFPLSVFPKFNWTEALSNSSRMVTTLATSSRLELNTRTLCQRLTCAAVVHVQSQKFLRRGIVTRAVRKIRERRGFASIFTTDPATFRVVRRSRFTFSVFVPFRARYLNEFT